MVARINDISVLIVRERVHNLRERGFSNEEIAAKIELSVRSVERYVSLPKPRVVTPRVSFGWQDEAACRGKPETWFFPKSRGVAAANDRCKAKLVCAGCPVSGECHDAAVANFEQNGIWAGRDFARVRFVHDPISGVVTAVGGVDGADAKVS